MIPSRSLSLRLSVLTVVGFAVGLTSFAVPGLGHAESKADKPPTDALARQRLLQQKDGEGLKKPEAEDRAGASSVQRGPVRISVTPQTKREGFREGMTCPSGGASMSTAGSRVVGLSYSIKVTNTGPKPLGDVKVRWAVIEHSSNFREGETTGKLGLGESVNCKTEVAEARGVQSIDGYLIEVIANEETIAVAESPTGIKSRIEDHRSRRARTRH